MGIEAMKDKIFLKGIVLGNSAVGDYDKRVVILTKERGKIVAFAKGARKQGSSFSGIIEPFNFGTFNVYESYDAYRFAGGEIREYFSNVKNDITGICYGSYFCEVLEYLTVEGVGDAEVLNLLYASLKAVEKNIPPELIRRIFELKLLALDGEMMTAFSCAKCGREKLTAFSIGHDGLICEDCVGNVADAYQVLESTVYTIQFILSSPIKKLFSFKVNDSVQKELDYVIGAYFSKHVPKKFKSLQILDTLS